MSRKVTHVAGWTSKLLSWQLTSPSQTKIFVHKLVVAHQICTINFCKWLYIFTGLVALYRHWRSWFLVQIPHRLKSWTMHVAFHLFTQYLSTDVETMLLTGTSLPYDSKNTGVLSQSAWEQASNIKKTMSKFQTKAAHDWRRCHETMACYSMQL